MYESKNLAELRDILAKLYNTPDDAKRIIMDAGIEATQINFSGNSIVNIWHDIIHKAENLGKIDDLVQLAQLAYKNNRALRNWIVSGEETPRVKANILTFLSRIDQRSDIILRSEERLSELQQGNFSQSLNVCIPLDADEISECLDETYSLSEIVAHLIYLRWETPPYIDLKQLEKEVNAKLKQMYGMGASS